MQHTNQFQIERRNVSLENDFDLQKLHNEMLVEAEAKLRQIISSQNISANKISNQHKVLTASILDAYSTNDDKTQLVETGASWPIELFKLQVNGARSGEDTSTERKLDYSDVVYLDFQPLSTRLNLMCKFFEIKQGATAAMKNKMMSSKSSIKESKLSKSITQKDTSSKTINDCLYSNNSNVSINTTGDTFTAKSREQLETKKCNCEAKSGSNANKSYFFDYYSNHLASSKIHTSSLESTNNKDNKSTAFQDKKQNVSLNNLTPDNTPSNQTRNDKSNVSLNIISIKLIFDK